MPPGLHIIGSGDQSCWSSFRFDVGILGTVIVRILVLACSIGVLVEILVVVAVVVATVVGAIFPYWAGRLRQSRVFGSWEPGGSKLETCTRPRCASVPSDSVVLSVASVTAGTTKLPSRKSVVCQIQKGAPKSVMTSPGHTRKRTAFWTVTAGGR